MGTNKGVKEKRRRLPFLEPSRLPERGRVTAVRNPVIRAPQATDLSAPVGTVMRPTLTVEIIDSLARGAQTLRENATAVLPVVDEQGRLVGALSSAGLARALAEMNEPTDAVGPFAEPIETLAPYATAAEALRRGEDGRTRVVVDDAGRPVGLVSALELWPRYRKPERPAVIGGMATPFGVYLTSGNVSAGAPWWGLMATGAAMFLMLVAGQVVATFAMEHGLPVAAAPYLAGALFFLFMRLVPLSGIHGAEHQVVNAIEREETLTLDLVRRMPLVHPRCGTNLMVGLSIFSAVFFTEWYPDQEVRLLPAAILGFVFAMPLGSIVQRYVTTRRPSDRQLQDAIRAGEELLRRNSTARQSRANPFQRIWNMGLLQVMAGATSMVALLAALRAATGWHWLPDLTR